MFGLGNRDSLAGNGKHRLGNPLLFRGIILRRVILSRRTFTTLGTAAIPLIALAEFTAALTALVASSTAPATAATTTAVTLSAASALMIAVIASVSGMIVLLVLGTFSVADIFIL
ncbi:MAG: hypothetical protein KDI61_06535, partial [Alphaproteobacteria bacterium]|nr:hypothetical protein [Alphaproteobacteria bacterium]